MALAGYQQVHLAATPYGGLQIGFGGNPFPATDIINAANPFPASPSPVYTLLTQNIVSGPVPFTGNTTDYPHANSVVDVAYNVGAQTQQATLYLVESYATVNGAL